MHKSFKEEAALCGKKWLTLEAESDQLLDKPDSFCDEAETKHPWDLLMEANALKVEKRKATEETKLLDRSWKEMEATCVKFLLHKQISGIC